MTAAALFGMAALLVEFPVGADEATLPGRPQAGPPQAEQQVGRDQPNSTQQGRRQLHGTVKRVKRVALRGAEGDHLVALIAGNAGRRMVVDLGPASNYRETPVMTGDRIAAMGPFAWISDRKVLFAQQVRVNGETVKVVRERGLDRRQLDRRTIQPNEAPLTGQIQQSKELRLRGIDRRHMVVRLKTDDGRQVLADLGSPKDIAQFSLESGRSITVQGPVILVSGKPLILARRITVDGKRAEIDRDVNSLLPSAAARESDRAAMDRTGSGKQPMQGDLGNGPSMEKAEAK
ncbi:MAG TPA: hypothetical protein VJ746_08450 [Nitrospira sp.]|nr:hypothetical protein [Nitrospira sp.]